MGNPVELSSAAFGKLIVSHYESLYRAALVLAGGRHADAEDLTQQTLLKAFQKREQLRQAQAARSWLLAIARNVFIKNLQKKSALPGLDFELNLEDPSGTEAAQTDFPMDAAELPTLLSRLDDSQRLVLHMYYFEDLSYRQIADALEIKLGTVMSRLARAKQRLREMAGVS